MGGDGFLAYDCGVDLGGSRAVDAAAVAVQRLEEIVSVCAAQ